MTPWLVGTKVCWLGCRRNWGMKKYSVFASFRICAATAASHLNIFARRTLTAPYMHNGVYQTLDEVLNFYNRGGLSLSLGLDLTVPT